MALVDFDPQTFKTRDASSYDSVTTEFDLFTQRLTQPLAERLVSLARPVPAARVLDVGSGTGLVALESAKRLGQGGRVLGVDLSERMLATAIAKVKRAGLQDVVEFRGMDAEALELEDQSFDVVLSLFALAHFPHPLAALKEMFRVLRPGGRFVIGVGSGPPRASIGGLIEGFKHLHEIILTRQHRLLKAPAFLNSLVENRLPERHEPEESDLASHSLNRTQSVSSLVRKAGFTQMRTDWLGLQEFLETPEEFWDIQRTFSSVARKRLLNASPAEVQAVRQEFLAICRKVQSNGGRLVYPFAAFYVCAERPSDRTTLINVKD